MSSCLWRIWFGESWNTFEMQLSTIFCSMDSLCFDLNPLLTRASFLQSASPSIAGSEFRSERTCAKVRLFYSLLAWLLACKLLIGEPLTCLPIRLARPFRTGTFVWRSGACIVAFLGIVATSRGWFALCMQRRLHSKCTNCHLHDLRNLACLK